MNGKALMLLTILTLSIFSVYGQFRGSHSGEGDTGRVEVDDAQDFHRSKRDVKNAQREARLMNRLLNNLRNRR